MPSKHPPEVKKSLNKLCPLWKSITDHLPCANPSWTIKELIIHHVSQISWGTPKNGVNTFTVTWKLTKQGCPPHQHSLRSKLTKWNPSSMSTSRMGMIVSWMTWSRWPPSLRVFKDSLITWADLWPLAIDDQLGLNQGYSLQHVDKYPHQLHFYFWDEEIKIMMDYTYLAIHFGGPCFSISKALQPQLSKWYDSFSILEYQCFQNHFRTSHASCTSWVR